MDLTNFFNPKSIAVIGASSDKTKVGYALMANLTMSDMVRTQKPGDFVPNITMSDMVNSRKIFPVSLSESEILGLKTYKAMSDIAETIDLAIIAVRADIVPQILEQCAAKKVTSAIIISAGFREMGPAGLELENKCAEIAKKNRISLLGPNCLGIINASTGLNASFAAGFREERPSGAGAPLGLSSRKPNIAFLSQSGALGTSLLDLAAKEGIGFSKFISLGNEADLSEVEFLEYLRDDPETKAILIYLEKLSNAPKFLQIAREIVKSKPIVVLKAGRSARGQKAVMSHTGSLAPADAVFSGACKQAGIITVESIREFFNFAKLFQLGITKPLQNLVILTNGGGPSVVAADLVDLSKSLSLVEFSEETKESLRKVLPPMAAVGNPVDIIGDALANRYADTLKILVELKEVDGILLILTPQMMTEVEATAKLVLEFGKQKPIIPIFIGGPTIEPGLKFLKDNGLTNFHFPKDAVEVLDGFLEVSPQGSRFLEERPQGTSLHQLPLSETLKIFAEQGIAMSGVMVTKKEDLIKAISKLGCGPFSLKAISSDIVHKTDAGVIRLNLAGFEEVSVAWDSIEQRIKQGFPQTKIEGMFLQPMGKGKEVIIGMKRDPVFGPAILFGLGGIFTEALKDTVIRIAPINKDLALNMMREIKGFPVLNGMRGEKSVNFEALAELIVGISNVALAHPEIKEIDLNPVMVTPEKAVVVDARMMG